MRRGYLQPEAGRSLLGAAQLHGENVQGVAPRDWNARAFEEMLRVERQGPGYAYYQLLAYFRRMSQRDSGRALQHLEEALAASSEAGGLRPTFLFGGGVR